VQTLSVLISHIRWVYRIMSARIAQHVQLTLDSAGNAGATCLFRRTASYREPFRSFDERDEREAEYERKSDLQPPAQETQSHDGRFGTVI